MNCKYRATAIVHGSRQNARSTSCFFGLAPGVGFGRPRSGIEHENEPGGWRSAVRFAPSTSANRGASLAAFAARLFWFSLAPQSLSSSCSCSFSVFRRTGKGGSESSQFARGSEKQSETLTRPSSSFSISERSRPRTGECPRGPNDRLEA
jgi:hypothetical protein